MSEEKEPKKEEAKPASGTKKRILFAVLGLLAIVGGSSVAGAALSPILGARVAPHAPKHAAARAEDGGEGEGEGEGETKDKEPKGLLALEPIVVDLRDQAGETHHLKIGIAFELMVKEMPEEEGKIFLMRARDAAITYVRTLTIEEVTDHDRFEAIRAELSAREIKAFGKKRASKMLITEYVVQ